MHVSSDLIVLPPFPIAFDDAAHEGSGDLIRLTFEDMLVQAKVSLVIAGHIHAYERTANIVNGAINATGPAHILIGDGGNREVRQRGWLLTYSVARLTCVLTAAPSSAAGALHKVGDTAASLVDLP